MKPQERKALLFTLAITRRHLTERRTALTKRLRDTAHELETIDRQLDDVEQSERYLKGE